ncbi:MAG: hypothetical protein ACT4OJ_07010 [Bacteroidota bacterium]
MKQFLLIALTAFLISCKSGNKQKPAETKTGDSITYQPPTTDPPGVVMEPAGKIDIESFGDIKLGQPYLEMKKVLGDPDTKSPAIEWAADGLLHEDWIWKAKGLVLNMSSDKNNVSGTMVIFTITATAPCTFKTKAGMGIGSTYAEVQDAYKKDIDPEATDKTQITVGSVYGGIIFNFKNDKAERVFLGAEAE